MTGPMRDEATERQVQAARPLESAWVSANAGSGKTRVLTDRVARLLLAGVAPERVLCLTYTKAAAAEMQNRLFRRLGGWAMLADTELRAELLRLGAEPPSGAQGLRAARRLFARAIEAPGGLKIQTIHSFCAALLRRFPLEAGVSPDFAEIDDRARQLLIEEILDALAEGPQARAVADLARAAPGDDLTALALEVAGTRDAFAHPPEGGFAAAFGLPAGYDEARLLAEAFAPGDAGLLARMVPLLAASSAMDIKAGAALAPMLATPQGVGWLPVLEGVLLYGKAAEKNGPFTAKIGAFPTKPLRQGAAAGLVDALEGLMARVEAARPRRLALEAAQRAAVLHAFARPFLAAYGSAKQARGVLDFDDLIGRSRALLAQPGVAEWVLYRLDGGIDHILVDEAQDTAPAQWEVIRLIAEEFTAGQGARAGVPRTLFVVGDLKQSIYSFQGADPAGFERMAGHFGTRLGAVGTPLNRLELKHSFRSAPAILRMVDAAFAGPEAAGLGGAPDHVAFHADMPGRVDLWPVIEKEDTPEDPPWHDPVDRLEPDHPDIRLARAIADQIAQLCDPGSSETLPLSPEERRDRGLPPGPHRRAPVPGDFLILVRRRSTLFAELIRACKARGLPIAGADRLKLGAELAVKDIAALLAFLALPEDSLSLAAALKSPLFGWDEDRLFRLAHGRGERFLWEALRDRREDEAETLAILDDLRMAADFQRPFELIQRLLVRHDGRRRLLARLGPEAEDGIDALVAQALAYERSEVPSLTGFLSWLEVGEVEVKRQLPTGGGVVRVMTVHGAKGLESPVVILPDTRPPGGGDRGAILAPEGWAIWKGTAEQADPLTARAIEARSRAQAEENLRLLYVAMTRAERWLIVAGSGDMGKQGGWHGVAGRALQASGAVDLATPTGPGLRLEDAGWDAGGVSAPPAPPAPPPGLPAWAGTRAPLPEAAPGPLSPSGLGGAKALPGEAGPDEAGLDEDAALLRGTRLHLLFEHLPALPPDARAEAARTILAASAEPPGETEAARLAAEAMAVIADPGLAHVFAPGALAEVPVAAGLPGTGRRMLGTIDRLILTPGRVLAVDFKTNAVMPDSPAAVPEGLLRQMGAYAAALGAVYPGRRVETAILWTAAPRLMPLPPDLVAAALARVPPGAGAV